MQTNKNSSKPNTQQAGRAREETSETVNHKVHRDMQIHMGIFASAQGVLQAVGRRWMVNNQYESTQVAAGKTVSGTPALFIYTKLNSSRTKI